MPIVTTGTSLITQM